MKPLIPYSRLAPIIMGIFLLGGCAMFGSYERPAYTVVEKFEGWEVRQYDPTIEARVTVEAPYDKAVTKGFRVLADFIFGENTPQADIAMTAPVRTQAEGKEIAMTSPVRATASNESQKIAMTAPVRTQAEGKEIAMTSPVRATASNESQKIAMTPGSNAGSSY